MKLLILLNDFPDVKNNYIGNIFVKEQVRSISKHVEQVNVLVPIPFGMGLKRKTCYSDYSIYGNVDVRFIRYFNPLFPITFSRFRKQWILAEFHAIDRFIQRENLVFDLIHAHYSWPSGALAVELKRKYKVPVVITEHSHITLYPRLLKKDPLLSETFTNADAIIRVNKKDLYMFKRTVPSGNFIYIPNGYSPERIKNFPKDVARNSLHLPLNSKVLINVARLSPVKGQRHLIQAMSIIAKERNDVICYIGGSGPLKSDLEKQTEALDLQDKVKLVGFIPDADLGLWLSAADFFVLPSLSEGNPTVMFEALGAGLPFVGTRVGGVPVVIASEDYGLLVEPGDPKDLADKIRMALGKEWDREKIREYAKQFTWENIAKLLLDVYQSVLSKEKTSL
ncbi:MAG: glycosyltransferase family 4 protein [Candidatus Methanosuratincola petrocarbonis]